MTVFMQIRLWWRNATDAERRVTWVATALVLALAAVSVALVPDDEAAVSTAFSDFDPDVGDGSAGATPGDGDEGEAVGDGAGGAGDDGGDQGSSGGGGSGAATAGGDGGAGGGAGATVDETPRSRDGVVLRASDRGVTPDELKVGVMLQNTAGLNDSGFSTGQRTDGEEYISALFAWATAQGRAGGRTITPVFRWTDPTSVEDQAAACRALVDDAKVFGAIDVASVLDTASLDCITNRQKGDTPFVHSVMWSRDWQARSGGNEVSYQAAIDRISVTWARDLGAMDWFPKGAIVGIFGDTCPATQPTIANVLKPALERAGASRVVLGLHDCNIDAVVSQPPTIATQMRLAQVSHVLIVTNFVAAQIFISTLAAQGHEPEYSTSDWFLNTSDPTAANFDPDQFDGAVGIASIGSMLQGSGKKPYDGWQLCSQIAADAGLPPIGPADETSTEMLSLCDNFLLFMDAVDGAGPNPTRAGWRAAAAGLGEHPSAVFGRSRFAPGKLTGSDFVHTIRWRRGCRCWRSVSGFRPAAA